MNPKYPVYVPTKGRWETRLTIKALEKMKVPYHIVIEKEEYDEYAKFVDASKIYVLPFSNKGLVASRVWIMEHSIKNGFAWHWQLDDNINAFYRLNRNFRAMVTSGTIFRIAEIFVDRYENIAIAGFNYDGMVNHLEKRPPFYLNTRVYSCSLINNSIPYRHRRVYNDDTDICLCALKDGWCTVLFNAFLGDKVATMTMSGGNTEDLYLIKDGRKKMAESLMRDHPDVVTMTRKWGRWQHQVNYKPFIKNNRLKKKPNVIVPQGVNNYGMKLVRKKEYCDE